MTDTTTSAKTSGGRLRRVTLSMARGVSLFLGVYAALSLVGARKGGNANIWWIDMGQLPLVVAWALQILVVVVLAGFAIRVPRRLPWRLVGTATCGLFAVVALVNALQVYAVARQGGVHLGFPVPFSLFVVAALAALGTAQFFGGRVRPARSRQTPAAAGDNAPVPHRADAHRPTLTGVAVGLCAVLACGLAFPLAQVICFGLSDYRTSVDAVVILGAQVHPDGTLSPTLTRRMDVGIALYQEHYTPYLIVSGGTGSEGVNEAEAMRAYAMAHGVPSAAIAVDPNGNTTELTVEHTITIAAARGWTRLGAVSSYYHMPRVKMLFQARGVDVWTTPAEGLWDGDNTFRFALREIPAWWFYWFKNVVV